MEAIISVIVLLPLMAFWLWMFANFMLTTDRVPPNERMLWLLGFVFVGIFAAAYYYRTVYRPK